MAFYEAATAWHAGEEEMHKLLRVPQTDNPTQPYLTPFAQSLLMRSPLIAIGTLDSEGRPWTTLWGGEPGFSRAIAQSTIGVKATVDRTNDPVVETLLGGKADGEVVQEQGTGKMVGGLAIDLESRRRVKLYGRMVAGALAATDEGIGEVQLVVKIEQSLGMHVQRPVLNTTNRMPRKLSKIPQQEAYRPSYSSTQSRLLRSPLTTRSVGPHYESGPFLYILLESRIRYGHQPSWRTAGLCENTL
jgi:hypothetical protein